MLSQKNSNPIIINNNNLQQQQQQQQQQAVVVAQPVYPVYYSSRLNIPGGMCFLIVILNLCLPGIGSIIAAILYGNIAKCGDRTGNIICHGIIQILTCLFVVGWIWAVIDAINYFEKGSCGFFACLD